MKICIARSQKNAYSETFIHNQIRGLADRGEVYTIHSGRLPERTENGKLLSPFLFWILHKILKTITGRRNNYFVHYGLKKYLKDNGVEVVLANYGLTGAHFTEVCSSLNIPLVVIFHGYDVTQKWVLKKYRSGYRRMFAYASALVAVSNEMKSKLIKEGAPGEKIVVIPYGIDLDQFSPSVEASPYPLFVAIGRFIEKKAPLLTVQAFHRVWQKHPDARLVMIGSRDELYKDCYAFVRRLKLAEAVQFTGVLTPHEIAAWLRKATVFVQHSVTASNGDMEGTPNSILEASASGVPVVSTLHGGIRDAVVHGTTGFLVKEHDMEGMAKYMQYLIEHPANAREMGAAGRRYMDAHYNFDRQVDKLYAVLQLAAHPTVAGTHEVDIETSRVLDVGL